MADDPKTDPPGAGEDVDAKFNTMFKAAMSEWVEENKPAPDKTVKPEIPWYQSLFGG